MKLHINYIKCITKSCQFASFDLKKIGASHFYIYRYQNKILKKPKNNKDVFILNQHCLRTFCSHHFLLYFRTAQNGVKSQLIDLLKTV